MRLLVTLLAVACFGCTAAITDPDDCVPDENGHGCNELPPPVVDSIPWPDSIP